MLPKTQPPFAKEVKILHLYHVFIFCLNLTRSAQSLSLLEAFSGGSNCIQQ